MSDEPIVIKLSNMEAYKELRKDYIIDLLKCTGVMLLKIVVDLIYWIVCIILFRTFFLLGVLAGYYAIKRFVEAVSSIKDVVNRIKDVRLVNRSMKKHEEIS
jgi:hypothetical protein